MKDRELKNAMKVIDMRKKIVDQMIVAFDGKSMTPLFIKRNAKSPLSHYIDLRGERLDRKYYQVVAHAKELKIPDNQMDAVRAMFDCFHDSSKTVEAEVIRQPKQRKERVMQKIEEVKVIRQDTVYVGEKSLKKMLGGGKKATMHLHKDCTGLSVTRYGAVDIMELKVEEQKKIVSELRECTICNGTSLRGKYSRGRIGKYTGGLTVEEKMAELKGIKIEKPVAPVVHVAALKEVQESALEKEAVIETCGVYTVREFGYFERLNGKFTTITIMFDENMDIHAGDQIRIEKIS